jgi:hypothetical protein
MALPATSTVDKTCGYGCNEVTEIGDSVPGDVPVESMVPVVCRHSLLKMFIEVEFTYVYSQECSLQKKIVTCTQTQL